MKVLVTGANGFLGSRIANYYGQTHQVYTYGHQTLDITSLESVEAVFSIVRPEVVVHCAAISNTGYAQEHPEESHQVNVVGTTNIAKAGMKHGAKLVYMSSDQVYNGTRALGLLPEEAPLSPVNVYGKDKLEAEKLTQEILPSAVGLRLTWMYDPPTSTMKLNSNLLVNIKQAFDTHTPLHIATHEYRGITNVWDVVKQLEACTELPGGIYNFGSENRLTCYETFTQTARLLGYDDIEQLIIADDERFHAQPRNLSMDITRRRSHGIDFPDTIEGVMNALQ